VAQAAHVRRCARGWCHQPDRPRRVLALSGRSAAMLRLDGFRDVIALTGAVGNFHTGALARTADQYAAMPSLHIAWAGGRDGRLGADARRQSGSSRRLPLITAFVVIATGNHFLLDVFAGAALAGTATLLELGAARWIPAIGVGAMASRSATRPGRPRLARQATGTFQPAAEARSARADLQCASCWGVGGHARCEGDAAARCRGYRGRRRR